MPLINSKISVYQRNDKYLIIFPDKPYWLVTRQGGYDLIKLFCECNTEAEVLVNFRQKYDIPKAEEIIRRNLDELHKATQDIYEQQVYGNKLSVCDIAMTKSCNLNCQACYRFCNQSTKTLRQEDIINFFSGFYEISDANCAICFTGGEPLLSWDLLTFSMDLVKKYGFLDVSMETNAIQIDQIKAKALVNLGLRSATLVLDGITPEIHELTRPEHSFFQIIEGMKILRDSGIKVNVRMSIHEKNIHQLRDFLLFCASEKVYPVPTSLAPLGRAVNLDLKPVLPGVIFQEIRKSLDERLVSLEYLSSSIYQIFRTSVRKIRRRTCCDIGKNQIFLDADGQVYPCIESSCSKFFALGSLREKSLKSIWENSTKLQELRLLHVDGYSTCRECDLKYICAGHCRAMTYNVTGKKGAPFIWCKDLHELFIEAMWVVAEEKELLKTREG